MPVPSNENEYEEQLFATWILAKYAHYVGDYSDSQAYFQRAIEQAKELEPHDKQFDPQYAVVAVKSDAAALAVSMHDYSLALKYLDEYQNVATRFRKDDADVDSTSLLRCAALIGLNRNNEVDKLVEHLIRNFDYVRGRAPWEAFPFGPTAIDPYKAARRIAGYYYRERRYNEALDLLANVESYRVDAINVVSAQPMPGRPWAQQQHPAAILEDEVTVLIGMNQISKAAEVMEEALNRRKNDSGLELKRDYIKSAKIALKLNQPKHAEQYSLMADRVQISEKDYWLDPLADTFGFIDP